MHTVWEYLRANKRCHLVWDSYEAVLQACREAWNFLIEDLDRYALSAPAAGRVSVYRAAGITQRRSGQTV
jgi:predicted RNase H-like HicB family nuclease